MLTAEQLRDIIFAGWDFSLGTDDPLVIETVIDEQSHALAGLSKLTSVDQTTLLHVLKVAYVARANV